MLKRLRQPILHWLLLALFYTLLALCWLGAFIHPVPTATHALNMGITLF